MIRRVIYLLLAAVAAAACARAPRGERMLLCVSIEPQRQMLEQIAGDRWEVVTLLAKGADPEVFDPGMSQRVAAADSRIYFTTGQLPFERAITASLGRGTRVVDTSDGIRLLTGTHGHSHEADPHYWTSLRSASAMAGTIARALAEADPEHADTYRANLAAYRAGLDSLDRATAARLAAACTRAFAIWHPSLSYYAADYGLRQIAVGAEHKELTVDDMRSRIDSTRARGVRVFFIQKEYDTRQARSLNSEIGSALVTIDPMAYDWQKQINDITDALTR